MLDMHNRRYIGNKYKIVNFIEEAAGENFDTFADLFAGTGAVAKHFAALGKRVTVNDNLYSNFVMYNAFLSDKEYSEEKIAATAEKFNNISGADLCDNYFSVYGEKYYSAEDAKKIGYIREEIENRKNEFSIREYYILIAMLLFAADRAANTVGHFEYFLKSAPVTKNIILRPLQLSNFSGISIFREDANILADKINADVCYIDPPYNARQYVNFYHVLENLATWNKPLEFEGNSVKFLRNHLKSGYSRSVAPVLMRELVGKLNTKLIIVSYNNTYTAKSVASVNKITEEQLKDILSAKGEVSVREIDYKYFNAGKTDLPNHKELLYTCRVK